jgi:hypothetical protein
VRSFDTTVPLSNLKKNHNAIAYQRVREAIAARIMRFVYIKSEENVSDVLTKRLSNEKFDYLIRGGYSVYQRKIIKTVYDLIILGI